jgi:SAM-dependent methyltransferase
MTAYQHNPALLQLPFDQYGRYQMMRDALDAARPVVGQRLRILDVGGFYRSIRGEEMLPARMFLPDDDVTVVDQPSATLPGYIQGDGRSLNFDDAAFDFVISCDTLEHVPAPDRPAFWRELLRVAHYGVLLAAPFASSEVVAAEALLLRYINVELGVDHVQLKEHADNGLPEIDATRALLDVLDLQYVIYPSGNVHTWLVMMITKHYLYARAGFENYELHEQLDAYYTRFLAANERCEPSYRHVFLVARRGSERWLNTADEVIAPTIRERCDAHEGWPNLVTLLIQLTQMRLNEKHTHTLTQAVSSQEETIRTQSQIILSLQRSLREQDAQIADLEQRSHWLTNQAYEARRALAAVENGVMMRLLRWWQQRQKKR